MPWIRTTLFSLAGALLFSGCSVGGGNSIAPVLKSSDGGVTWEQKIRVNERQTIAGIVPLTFVIDPTNADTLYMGTQEHGVVVSRNGAEQWERTAMREMRVYAIAVDPRDGAILYASGVRDNIAKLFRSDDRGSTWNEIYAEPRAGTVITALAVDPLNPDAVILGTSRGVLLRSPDRGSTWQNGPTVSSAVKSLTFDALTADNLYIFTSNGTIFAQRSREGEPEDITPSAAVLSPSSSGSSVSTALTDVSGTATVTAFDVSKGRWGILVAGAANGAIVRSTDGGQSWSLLPVLSTSSGLPVRAIAVNPQAADDVLYNVGRVLYRSANGSARWVVQQGAPDSTAHAILFHPVDPSVIYSTWRVVQQSIL